MIMNLTNTQKSIIKILFVEKESSRSILANKLELTNAALTLTIKPLLEEGIILETKNNIQRVGRKELKLNLNPSYGYFLGIDIKKNNTYYSLMDFQSSLISFENSKNTSLKDFIKEYKNKIISIGITMRGFSSIETFKSKNINLFNEVSNLSIPFYVFNNVDALADIYSLNYSEDSNFILIKYGPGVGSSIYVNGMKLGNSSELGHTFYKDKTIEDTISYYSLIGKEVKEEEGTEIIKNDLIKLKEVIHVLSFGLLNADALLSLQKIVLSGLLLSDESVIENLKKEISLKLESFDLDKLCIYPNYNEINVKKSCIGAFIRTFK